MGSGQWHSTSVRALSRWQGSKRRVALAHGLVIALAFAGCGRLDADSDGLAGSLARCISDSQCGSGACLCGVCSQTCSADSECADTATAASCTRIQAPTCGVVQLCLPECERARDCASGFECHAGSCILSDEGWTTPTTSAEGGAGGDGSTPTSSGGVATGGASATNGGKPSQGGSTPSYGGSTPNTGGAGADGSAGAPGGASGAGGADVGRGGGGPGPGPDAAGAGGSEGGAGGDGGAGGAGGAPVCHPPPAVPIPMACPNPAQVPGGEYRATALGALGTDSDGNFYSDTRDINAQGHIAGIFSLEYACGDARGFLFRHDRMIELPPLPGHSRSLAWALNDDDIVIGLSDEEAVLWENGVPVSLGLGNVWLNAINNHGQIVGWDFPNQRGLLWEAGVVTWLGDEVRPEAINDAGQIVGALDKRSNTDAFIWQDGVLTLLPVLDRTPESWNHQSGAWDINESGQIVGDCHDNRGARAVFWDTTGEILDITPPTTDAFFAATASSINDHGVIVGTVQEEGELFNGVSFVFDHGTTDYLDAPPREFVSVGSMEINNRGEIAATAETQWPPGPTGQQSWRSVAFSRDCFAACCD